MRQQTNIRKDMSIGPCKEFYIIKEKQKLHSQKTKTGQESNLYQKLRVNVADM